MNKMTFLCACVAFSTVFGDIPKVPHTYSTNLQKGFKLPKIKDLFKKLLDKLKEKLNLVDIPTDVEPTKEEIERMEELVQTTLDSIQLNEKQSKKEAEKSRIIEACSKLIPYLKSDELTDGEKVALFDLIKKLMKKL